MNIITLHERARGCGFRAEGGFYLRTDGLGRECGALPIELSVCPTCHHGIKPARGWTWVNLAELASVRGCDSEKGCGNCPIADAQIQRVGLLWIGEKYYPSPQSFNAEAREMGLSRRIARNAIPRGFKLGETWVALAHRKAITQFEAMVPSTGSYVRVADEQTRTGDCVVQKPGIFHVFCPSRIEYVVRKKDSKKKLRALEERGITLVRIVRVEGGAQ